MTDPIKRPDPSRGAIPSWLWMLLFVAFIMLLVWRDNRSRDGGPMPVAVGTPLPEILAAVWLNVAGKIPSSEAYRGQPLLVDCWASWCPPCRTEMPHLAKIAGRWQPRGIRFLGLSPEAKPGPIGAFIQTVDQFNWPVAYGANLTIEMLQVNAFPTLILFDADGRAVWSGHHTIGLEQALAEVIEP